MVRDAIASINTSKPDLLAAALHYRKGVSDKTHIPMLRRDRPYEL